MKRNEALEWNKQYVKGVITGSGFKKPDFARHYNINPNTLRTALEKRAFWKYETWLSVQHLFPEYKTGDASKRKGKSYSDNPVWVARMKLGMSREELAEQTGVNVSSLQRFEQGGGTLREVNRIAIEDFLGIDLPTSSRFMDEADVFDILTSKDSNDELAEKYNRDVSVIRAIKRGDVYKDVFEEVMLDRYGKDIWEQLCFNRTYVESVIKASGMTHRDFITTYPQSYYMVKCMKGRKILPQPKTALINAELFPLAKVATPHNTDKKIGVARHLHSLEDRVLELTQENEQLKQKIAELEQN